MKTLSPPTPYSLSVRVGTFNLDVKGQSLRFHPLQRIRRLPLVNRYCVERDRLRLWLEIRRGRGRPSDFVRNPVPNEHHGRYGACFDRRGPFYARKP